MIKVGLTGSIAVGKSFILDIFKEKYFLPVFNSDNCVRSLYKENSKLINFIKKEILYTEHNFNNSQIARVVFSDKEKLMKLEGFIHPLVKQERKKFISEEMKKNSDIVIIEIPLLFEKKLEKEVDHIIRVRTSKDIQKQRVLKRNGMTEELFNKINKRQMATEDKAKKSGYIIDSYDYDNVTKEVKEIYEDIVRKVNA